MRRIRGLMIVFLLILSACVELRGSSAPSSTAFSSTSTSPASATTSSATLPIVDVVLDAVSGIFSGTLLVTPVPGAPGDPYSATFTVVVDSCSNATLIQEPGQESTGTYQIDAVHPLVLHLNLIGEGADYREGYRIDLVLVEPPGYDLFETEPQAVGINAGGGHGFGDPPDVATLDDELQYLQDLLMGRNGTGFMTTDIIEDENITTGMIWDDLDYPVSLRMQWFAFIEGPVLRTGDAPSCGD